MNVKAERVGRPALLVVIVLLLVLAIGAAVLAAQGSAALKEALDGRRLRTEETAVSQFSLREQMVMEQTQARIRGWLSVAESEQVTMNTSRGVLRAQLYSAIGGREDAPWALVLHGGLGTDHMQVQDIACVLSLEGYRVLTPDLYAHGESAGEVSSLGLVDAQDVRTWVEWILMEDMDARVVIFGQDEGGVAALLAAGDGLPACVAAVAADSAYVSVQTRAGELMAEMETGWLGKALLNPAYRLTHGVSIKAGSVTEAVAKATLPLLIIHGTGDSDVLAWQGEDIAAAAGERAQLLLIEGAAHGMARYQETETYYDTLLGFFERGPEL